MIQRLFLALVCFGILGGTAFAQGGLPQVSPDDARVRQSILEAQDTVRPYGQFDVSAYRSEFGALGKYASLRAYIVNVINFLLSFLGLVAFIALVYAGFLYVTAGGDDGQQSKAKNIIIFVVIGIFVILAAYALVFTIITKAGTGTVDRAPRGQSSGGGGGSGFNVNIGSSGNGSVATPPIVAGGSTGGGTTSGQAATNVPAPGGGAASQPIRNPSRIQGQGQTVDFIVASQINNTLDGEVQWQLSIAGGRPQYRTTSRGATSFVFPVPGSYTVEASYMNNDGLLIHESWPVVVNPLVPDVQ